LFSKATPNIEVFAFRPGTDYERLEKGQMFGEALVFAGRRYASYVVSEVVSEILNIPKKLASVCFQESALLLTYLRSISEKILNLSSIIEILSLSTVKKKIASYLLELSLEKDSQTLKLPAQRRLWPV
jgi:CRP/FNR family transcriptional regulator